jgi:hypothetical protein
MCVCHTSPAVASVSLTLFYHSGRLPRSRLRLFRCATSPAMSLLSLTVVSHSGRLPCSRLRLFRCATSPSICLLSRTVVSHSGRLLAVAFVPVCYLSCHVFAIANGCFSQPSSSPDPAAAPYTVVPPWALNLLLMGWLRVRGCWGFGRRRHCWLFGSG